MKRIKRRAVTSGLLLTAAACASGESAPPPDDSITMANVAVVPAPPEASALPASVTPQPPPEPEPVFTATPQIRALWIDAFHDGIKTPTQVDTLVRSAHAAGVNTLIVQVRRRGDAYYSRTSEPRVEDPTLQLGFDPLQALIDRARASRPRLEVHAWIATVALWKEQRRPPANPDHTFNRHGPDAPSEDNWISLNERGQAWDTENYMLDPGHPAAARYVSSVAEELARNYTLDGIHLDLVRYAGVQWGYNPTSLARFNTRYNPTGHPGPLPGQNDARWQQWRRDQVTALVRRVYLDCLAVRPAIKVSAAVIGWGNGPVSDATWRATSAYRNVFQDWKAWLEDGIVDLILPMNYDNEANPEQREWFDRWIAWERDHQGKRQIAAGVGLFLNTPEAGLAQIRRALAPTRGGARLAGAALYSYAVTNAPAPRSETPATPNEQFFSALSGADPAVADPPFAGVAPVPAMPWKDQPGAFLRGVATGGSGGSAVLLDGATVRLDGPTRTSLQTDGNGYFGAADLVPGEYTVTVVQSGVAGASVRVSLPAGHVTTLDL